MTIIQHFPRNASVSIGAGTYTGTWVETFDAVADSPLGGAQAPVNGGLPPGTHYNGVTSFPNRFGLSFGKCFVGQTVVQNSEELVTGTASSPLTLQAGPTGQNLVVVTAGSGQVIAGQSSAAGTAYPNATYTGSGSVAIIWPTLQSAIRFDVLGTNGEAPAFENIRVEFYGADGVQLSFFTEVTPTSASGGTKTYQFVTTPSVKVIKGIRISNNAFGQYSGLGGGGGFGIDNIHYTP